MVAAFRRHLRTCSKLPAGLTGSDDVKVKLRVFMRPDGKLAAEPMLIEASASMKGPLLMQGAISALQACQPYAMLPADRYGEWKVLDLSFTPQDFSGGWLIDELLGSKLRRPPGVEPAVRADLSSRLSSKLSSPSRCKARRIAISTGE